MSYQELVETIKSLSVHEKEELKALLDKLLIEARREEIRQNYVAGKEEEQKLTFHSDTKTLRESA